MFYFKRGRNRFHISGYWHRELMKEGYRRKREQEKEELEDEKELNEACVAWCNRVIRNLELKGDFFNAERVKKFRDTYFGENKKLSFSPQNNDNSNCKTAYSK